TGLGIASISLAFACAQLMWGITQPIAGAVADKYGTGRVIAIGAVLVMLGTVLTPHATTTWMLVLLIGVVAAGGGGMAGLGVLMSAVARALPPEKRGIASGMVNAGGSFGQFVVAPLAILLTTMLGWVGALTALGLLSLAIVPLAFVLRHRPLAHEERALAPLRRARARRIGFRLCAENDDDVHDLCGRARHHLPLDGAADGRLGGQAARGALRRDALRHRHALASGRR